MHRTLWLLAFLLPVLVACSEDSSTEPEPDPVEDTLLAEMTIDGSGGRLETDDFVLTVPSGCFGSPASLELHESTEHEFGSEAVSRDFRIEGLPEVFADTMIVRIRYDRVLEGESYVAFGSERTALADPLDPLETASCTVFELIPAEATAGYLEAKLPPRIAGAHRGSDPWVSSTAMGPEIPGSTVRPGVVTAGGTRRISATTSYETRSSAHFTARFPKRLASHMDPMLGYFETGFDVTDQLGIGFEGRAWEWPAQIQVLQYAGGGRLMSLTLRDEESPIFQLKTDAITASRLPEFQAAALGALLTTGIAIPNVNAIEDPNLLWWHNAVISWAATKYGGPAAPTLPPNLGGNETLVLTGLPYGFNDAELSAKYGAPWTATVDFLTGRDGIGILEGIYSQIKAGTLPVPALLTRLPDPEYAWWPDFVHSYFTGGYYGIESALFLARIDDQSSFTIASAADSVHVFGHNHTQLSAKPYRIRFDYSGLGANASLRLELGTGQLEPEWAALKVYSSDNGALTFLSEGDLVTVDGIQEMALQGRDVIPLVVNCYTNEPYSELTPLTLGVRVVEPVTGFTKCSIEAWTIGTFREGSNEPVDELWLPSFHGIGSMTDNTFTGELDPALHPAGVTGTVTLTLDPVTKAILSFSGSGASAGSAGSSTWSISGAGVPMVENDPETRLRYFENGPEACYYISGMTYVWSPNSGDGKTLIDYWCGDNSEIRVTLKSD